MFKRKKLLVRLISVIFFIFVLNFIADKLHWYFSIWWFDMPMHLLGGFWLGLVFLWLFPARGLSLDFVFKIIFGVLFIGVGWELFEFMVDKIITFDSFNSLDTLSDICFDIAGGLLATVYFSKRIVIRSNIEI